MEIHLIVVEILDLSSLSLYPVRIMYDPLFPVCKRTAHVLHIFLPPNVSIQRPMASEVRNTQSRVIAIVTAEVNLIK